MHFPGPTGGTVGGGEPGKLAFPSLISTQVSATPSPSMSVQIRLARAVEEAKRSAAKTNTDRAFIAAILISREGCTISGSSFAQRQSVGVLASVWELGQDAANNCQAFDRRYEQPMRSAQPRPHQPEVTRQEKVSCASPPRRERFLGGAPAFSPRIENMRNPFNRDGDRFVGKLASRKVYCTSISIPLSRRPPDI